jgi:hypothetical protein
MRQQRLQPRRALTSRRGACACGLTARGGAICDASSKYGGRCGGANLGTRGDNCLIRPRKIFGEEVDDGATMADATIARGNDNFHHIREEARWRKVPSRLGLLEHGHADAGARCSDRERAYPGEPLDISDEQQPHRRLVDVDRLPDGPNQFDHFTNAQGSERILAPIGAWLQRDLNAAAKQVNA